MSVLPQVVTRNWRLKLSAFALAVFLWVIVTVQPRNREILQSVPVRVVMEDPGWTVAEGPNPATVSVQLGGLARDLMDLPRGAEAVVRVPIGQVNRADTVIELRRDWVVLGGGSNMIVQNITPAQVTLRFEPTLTTAVPLFLRTRGELPDGLALVQPLGLSPPVATVRGPARLVEALDSVALEPLDLGRVTESGLQRVRVDTTGLSGVSFQPNVAQISVNLQPVTERVVGGVPVVIEPPAGIERGTLLPEPATVQVTLRGAVSLVNQTNVAALAALVSARDLEGIAAGNTWSVPVRIVGAPSLVRAVPSADSVRVLRSEVPPPPATPPDTLPRPDTIPGAAGRGAG